MKMLAPLRHLCGAFRFLTVLAVPGPHPRAGEQGRIVAWFPLPGLALGGAAAGVGWVLAGHLAAGVAAVLVVGGLAWLTGALHLDGVADVADGLGGGHGDPARTLAIMRDSRIGAFGATALVLLLGVKVVAVAELLGRPGAPWALVCAPAVARFAAVPLVVFFPYAAPKGTGRAFHDQARGRELAIAAVLTAATLAAAGLRALLPAGAALAAAASLALVVRRRLGGLTGDAYGAAIELAETAFLVCAGLR
jgi:adenosylcobinamide-GDP ribazoletransferase